MSKRLSAARGMDRTATLARCSSESASGQASEPTDSEAAGTGTWSTGTGTWSGDEPAGEQGRTRLPRRDGGRDRDWDNGQDEGGNEDRDQGVVHAEDGGVVGVPDEFTSPWWGGLGPVGALGLVAAAVGLALWTYFDLPGSPDIPATTYHEASRVAAIGLVVAGTWAVGRRRSRRRGGARAADRRDTA